jgi:Mrp family chromosome partitioning ATPase
MNRSPSQPTVHDLLKPVLAHRLLIAVIVALAVGASVAYSAAKTPVYQASASVSYQDETYALGLVGLNAPATQTSDQLAAAGADTIIQPSVAQRVARMIHSPLSADVLLGSVSATVQPNSNLVVIQASASTPEQAQRLANAFAQAGAAATNAHVRSLYDAAYRAAVTQLPATGNRADPLVAQDASRLRVLSKIATAAQVVKPADLPATPSSPRPVRDAALAGLLGLVVALLAAFVRDSFDRRLRTPGDVEQAMGLPLVGQVRVEALGRSPRGKGAPSAEPIDWELFQILRRNVEFIESDHPIRSVAVTSALPEEGKTTVAAFLAFTSAAAGKRTLLIEGDLRRPMLARRLNLAKTPGVTDLVLGQCVLSDVIQDVEFGDPLSSNGHGPSQPTGDAAPFRHHLSVIPAGSVSHHPIEVLRSKAMSAMLTEVFDTFDLVVLDTAPLLSVVDTLELVPSVDAAVMCVRVDRTTRQQAGAGKAALERLPPRPTGLVVTGTRRGQQTEYGYYGEYA